MKNYPLLCLKTHFKMIIQIPDIQKKTTKRKINELIGGTHTSHI